MLRHRESLHDLMYFAFHSLTGYFATLILDVWYVSYLSSDVRKSTLVATRVVRRLLSSVLAPPLAPLPL